MRLKENWRAVLHMMLCLGLGISLSICLIIWLHTPPAKANQLRPLIEEIGAYKATNGHYPISCGNFASLAKLTNRFSVYTGSANQGGIQYWSYWEVEKHDFTVLLTPDGFNIFTPVAGTERRQTFSFNFVAWQYDSKNSLWRKGRIYYSSFGPYWKPDFLR